MAEAQKTSTVTFVKDHAAKRGTSSYRSPSASGTIYLGHAAFNGAHPDKLVIQGVPAPLPAAAKKPKESKEERKARLAKLTPADRLAIRKANLAKAEERLAKKAAKAAPATDPKQAPKAAAPAL